MKKLPGTLWNNRGRYNWKVRLPGTPARKNYPLRRTNMDVALAVSERGFEDRQTKSLAESIAWRMWENASRSTLVAHDTCMTLEETCAAFLAWGATYYRRSDGTPTGELLNCEIALRVLRSRFGNRPIDDTTYDDVLRVREELLEAGHNRTTINQRIGIIKRLFAWALENRHCAATTKSEVWAITALKKNRSIAPEAKPVGPVAHKEVKKTFPFLPANLQAMVRVQELCGARPSEMCTMRPKDIEQRNRGPWVYRPPRHKTEHKSLPRLICLGRRALEVLRPIMASTDPDERIFRPSLAQHERQNKPTFKKPHLPNPHVHPGEEWTSNNYAQAIRTAVRVARKSLAKQKEAEDAKRLKEGKEIPEKEEKFTIANWSPNQLRHSCGTRVRRKFGADAARSVLGHSGAGGGTRITDTYTRDAIEHELISAASRPMSRIG